MKKKLLSIVLAISMICAFVPLVVSAETTATSGTCGDNVTWTLDDDGTLTISGTGNMENYNYMEDYVKSPFYNNENIKSAIIENGVTGIGSCIFYGCSNLTSVNIPNGVTNIGWSAFEGCSRITSVNIPNGVTRIEGNTFKDCISMTSINIPDSITSIGLGAFEGCISITNVNIPNSITIIRWEAFEGCSGLKSINIPNGIKYIADSTFEGCSSLTEITIPDSVISVGPAAFKGCRSITSINIPNGATSIGDSAFAECSSLTEITIPDSIENIGSYVIDETPYYLNENNWENEVLYIGKHLIEAKQQKIKGEYNIKDGTKTIAGAAFSFCDNLTSVIIPNSVMSIGHNAFYHSSNLISIIIPDSVVSIGEELLDGSAYYLDENNWENGVLYLGNHLIKADDSKLNEEYKIKDGTKTIANQAFYQCDNIKNIIISNGVTRINEGAFLECTNLNSITIPISISTIGNGAFAGCESLSNIYYEGTIEQWNKINKEDDDMWFKNATIHYKRDIPLTTATIKTEKVGEAYTFNVEPEQKYEDCYVYAAMYDENGLLTGFNRVPLETSGSTNISVGKTDNAESAKVFILSDMLQPVIATQEFTLE